MKKSYLVLIIFLPIIIMFFFTQCKKEKEHNPLTITLHDKPLEKIQSYINGKWKLQYAFGGIGAMKYPARNNPYMILSPDHIVLGNDSTGIVVDTTIVWKREKDFLNGDSTYLLTYFFPSAYVVDRIYNDTLILADNVYDGYYYHYTR